MRGVDNAGNVNWSTPKLAEALASLETNSQREAFRQLVEGLTFHAIKRGWAPLRQWAVFVDLVRDGWRPKADA